MALKIIPSSDDIVMVTGREYIVKIACENCGSVYYAALPKGTPVNIEIQNSECPNCECKDTLKIAN